MHCTAELKQENEELRQRIFVLRERTQLDAQIIQNQADEIARLKNQLAQKEKIFRA